jgi:hypothetical protein
MGVTQPVVAYWEREPVALRIEQLAALAEPWTLEVPFCPDTFVFLRDLAGPAHHIT